MQYLFKCPTCGERRVTEAEFKDLLDPEMLARLASKPEAEEAMLAFQSIDCPKCNPSPTEKRLAKLSIFSPSKET